VGISLKKRYKLVSRLGRKKMASSLYSRLLSKTSFGRIDLGTGEGKIV